MGTWEEMKVPFIVPTPKPYIVDLTTLYDQGAEFPFADVDKENKIKARLLQQVQVLRSVMQELGIEEAEAHEIGLTLNIHSAEELIRRAFEQDKNGLVLHIRKSMIDRR